MKIINKYTNETIAHIIGGNNLSLDEALDLVGEIYSQNEDENVLVYGTWYYYDDLDYIA